MLNLTSSDKTPERRGSTLTGTVQCQELMY